MKDLSKAYPVWFCDVWGVVHDGAKPIASAVTCLENHRQSGGKVILVTNSPNTSAHVVQHLAHIGVSPKAYDAIVTSGDVTRALIVEYGGNQIYHIGTSRDYSIFEGLNVARVDLEHATAIVCSGLFDELHEHPEDYRAKLAAMKNSGLKMICANPDKVVRKGPNIVPCAGALAAIYQSLGGTVLMAGKPFTPIYDLALKAANTMVKSHVLAIGDGPETDIKGAADYGLPCVLITDGINHGADVAVGVAKAVPHAKILASMSALDWA